MIEKLPFETTLGEYEGKKFDIKSPTSPFDMQVKINELVDFVNNLDGLIGLTNNAVQALAEENNIHEKQIDELQMKLEPESVNQQKTSTLKPVVWTKSLQKKN